MYMAKHAQNAALIALVVAAHRFPLVWLNLRIAETCCKGDWGVAIYPAARHI